MNSGILLLDKTTGSSSARALYPVKRRFPRRKVGHTGTLDPFASGLMVVLVGQATRLSRFFLKLDKRYTGIVFFGSETDTLDRLGSVVATGGVPPREIIEEEARRFVGTTEQVPPSYSALKVGGKRAYALARAGEEVTLSPRSILVHELTITPIEDTPRQKAPPPNRYRMAVHCESGTYIRSLARDIGRAAGSYAYLEELRRDRVGPFSVADAFLPEAMDAHTDEELLLPIPDAIRRLGTIPVVSVTAEEARNLRGGKMPHRSVTPRSMKGIIDEIARFQYAGVVEHLLLVDTGNRCVALMDVAASGNTDVEGAVTDITLSYGAVFPLEDDEVRP